MHIGHLQAQGVRGKSAIFTPNCKYSLHFTFFSNPGFKSLPLRLQPCTLDMLAPLITDPPQDVTELKKSSVVKILKNSISDKKNYFLQN